MIFSHYRNVDEMPRDVDAFLARDVLLNNVPLGVLERFRRGVGDRKDYHFFIVRDAEQQVMQYAHLMHPHPLCLSQGCAIKELKEGIVSLGIAYSTVQGEKSLVEAFLGTQPADVPVHVERQGLYKLTRVKMPAKTDAEFAPASLEDLEVLTDWTLLFCDETDQPAASRDEVKAVMERKIRAEHCFVLKKDGILVSMVGVGRILPGGTSIAPVFTPKEFRRRGYAAELTAKVSQTVLDKPGNSFVCLFTQLDNPTSNKIYQDIGYEWVCEFAAADLR